MLLASPVSRPSALWLLCALPLLAIACGDDEFDTDAGSSADASVATDAQSRDSAARDGAIADGAIADGALADGSPRDAAGDGDASTTLPDASGNGPAPVQLGGAGIFTILAEASITNVPISAITGDIGLSPAAATFITGMSLIHGPTFDTSAQVIGRVFTVGNDPPTPASLTVAVEDMHLAYTDAASRPGPTSLDLLGGAIGAQTLPPGLYKWNTAVAIPTDLTLDGGPEDTWIMQITGDLALSADTRVILAGGARAKNVVWQVAGAVVLGARAHAGGSVLGKTAITLQTGATVSGRLFAQTTAALDHATVTPPTL